MMDIAKQTLMATQTVGDLLGGQIAGALNWIGGGITSMTNAIVNEFMGFVGNNADAREAIEEAQNKSQELGGELADLQKSLRAEESKGGEADQEVKAVSAQAPAHRRGILADGDDPERSTRPRVGWASTTYALDASGRHDQEIPRRGDLVRDLAAAQARVGHALFV